MSDTYDFTSPASEARYRNIHEELLATERFDVETCNILAAVFSECLCNDEVFDDFIPVDRFDEIKQFMLELIPWVFPSLNPRWSLRSKVFRPAKYYTKRMPFNPATIRELLIYTGFETDVEFYGWKVVDPRFLTIEIYLEEGTPLNTFVDHKEDLPNDYEEQMCNSVRWLNANSLVHRDLKPQNWIVVDNKVKLIDFGSTVSEGEIVNNLGHTVGMEAPEVRYAFVDPKNLGGVITAMHKSDLWSLGASILAMRTGVTIFANADIVHTHAELAKNGELVGLLFRLLVLRYKHRRL